MLKRNVKFALRYIARNKIYSFPAGYMAAAKLFTRTAYPTDIPFWIFVCAGILVLTIIIFSVSWQAIRLAFKNLT